MMLLGLLLLAASGLVVAQKGPDCYCYLPVFCRDPEQWNTAFPCDSDLAVCCKNYTEEPPSTEQNPTSGDEICGKRTIPTPTTTTTTSPQGGGALWKILSAGDGSTIRGEFPWMVAIMKLKPSGRGYDFLCGGSIIHPSVILTAAHSVSEVPASDLLVKAGVWNISDQPEKFTQQKVGVQQVKVHPDFQKDLYRNDVAVLFLNETLKNTDIVNYVCLPSSTAKFDKNSCVATGWGADKKEPGTKNTSTLRKTDLGIIKTDKCRQIFKNAHDFDLHESMVCAGGSVTNDTCQGDGGGPLMCTLEDKPDTYVQVGITSFGFGCGNGIPGGYASVEHALNWIEREMSTLVPNKKENPKYKSR